MSAKLAAVAVLMTVFATAKAADGDDVERRWAFDVRLNPACATASVQSSNAVVTEGKTWSGPNFSAHVEYYLPFSHFSLVGGYEDESLDFCGGEVYTTLSQLMFGSRYYPLPRSWFVQPYVGASAFLNVAGRDHSSVLTVSGSENYTRDYTISRPLLSVAPSVGVDLYIFSSLALSFEYGYRMAIDGRADINSTFPERKNATTTVHSRLHRQAFSVGLKVTFPFSFTNEDAMGLINSLLRPYDSDSQKRYRNSRKSVKRPLIYY